MGGLEGGNIYFVVVVGVLLVLVSDGNSKCHMVISGCGGVDARVDNTGTDSLGTRTGEA